MTNEELDRLWFEAMHQSIEANENFVRYRFAALVAAAEREQCAIACEKISESLYMHDNVTEGRAAQDCADAIWARGEA